MQNTFLSKFQFHWHVFYSAVVYKCDIRTYMTPSAVPNMLVLDGDSENSAAAFNQQTRKYDEIADGIFRDAVPWLYPGIIYAQNVMLFYHTQVHVTSLMPFWKVRPFLHQLSQNSHMLNSIMCKSLMQNFTKTGQHMCKVWIQIHLCPSVKYGLHCTNFHEIYSNSINFCGTNPTLNFTQIKAENKGKISFMPLSKAPFSLSWFSRNSILLDNFCKQLLHQISWKYGKQFSCCYQFTDQ